MTITTPSPDIDRDRYGRPLITPPDGGKPTAYTRCTTFVDCLEDKFNLQKWQQRMVATGLANRADLLLAVSAAGDDKRKLDSICADAREAAGASGAATTGTALHALTELIDRGQPLPALPETARADLEAYAAATAHLTATHIEQFTVVDELKVGGTADRIVQVDGVSYIADIKTGSIEWGLGKIAMQLAVYAHGTGYSPSGQRFDLGPIDQNVGIIIHLPAGQARCELVPVDLAAGWEGVQLATQVRGWRSRKDFVAMRPEVMKLLSPAPAVEAPRAVEADSQPAATTETASTPDPAVAALENAIATATSRKKLEALWEEHTAIWTNDLTELASARARLLDAA